MVDVRRDAEVATIGGVVVGVIINRRLPDCGVVAGAVMVSKALLVGVVVGMSSAWTSTEPKLEC